MADKITKSDAEWRAELTPEQYEIMRKKGTERAFTGAYWNDHSQGVYSCACCGQELFSSDTKFNSGTGWPSFTQPVADKAVETETDRAFGMARTEASVQPLRGASGPCLSRWPGADRLALLHQFGLAEAQAQGVARGAAVRRAGTGASLRSLRHSRWERRARARPQ